MKHLIAVLFALTLTECAMLAPPHFQEGDKSLLALQKEKDKLKRLSDPVDRTLSNIKISAILVTLIGDSVKSGNQETMERRVAEYVTTIQDAHDTMMKTGRDAHRKSRGFKELEIALRRQAIQLKDIGDALTLDQREPIDKARHQASNLRDDLLRALFGS